MTTRLALMAVLAGGLIGCEEPKPTPPTGLIQPPGSDADGGTGGKAKKVKHADQVKGDSTDDK